MGSRRRPGCGHRTTSLFVEKPPLDIALFDLDGTLLNGDSNVFWSEHLAALGLLDIEAFHRRHGQFDIDYDRGLLDPRSYHRFMLGPLRGRSHAEVATWQSSLVDERVTAALKGEIVALLDKHRAQGHMVALVTATSEPIAAPFAAYLDIPHLLASGAVLKGGRHTGEPSDPSCFQQGKVLRYRSWLAELGIVPNRTWFYSDSHNDLPLLQHVSDPVAVYPDARLLETAKQRGWRIINGPIDSS